MSALPSSPQLHRYAFPPEVVAFSTLRQGGASRGAYAEFNVNAFCGDEAEAVSRNRRALVQLLGIPLQRLLMPHQVHGSRVRVVDERLMQAPQSERMAELEGVDALITDLPGVCIGVSTADCAPLLLYDPVHRVVAAVHSGWRGTVQGIAARVVHRMAEEWGSRPADLLCHIGPHIGVQAFEVGPEVVAAFEQAGFPTEVIVRHDLGSKPHISLSLALRHTLLAADLPLQNICDAGICSFTNVARFFSARRLGTRSGRTFSGILIQ